MSVLREFEGKTIEHAIRKACGALDIEKEALAYEVISHGSRGIFGIVGVRKAKIRVKATIEDAPAGAVPAAAGRTDETTAAGGENTAGQKPGRRAQAVAKGEAAADVDGMDVARQVLQKMVHAISSSATITCRQEGDQVLFTVDGGNAALLIGKHGQTLEAMQYLVEKIVNRHSEGRVHLQIDVGGYLENRRENLRSLARRMAAKAKKNGKPVSIGQLSPQERRIVHLELKADQQLRTQSVGEGFIRKLVIIPRKPNRTGSPPNPAA